MAISMTVFLWGCANVPRQYVRMAEPGTTLTALTAHPEMYRGKVVLLGGVIIEEENEQYLWLRVKNRPPSCYRRFSPIVATRLHHALPSEHLNPGSLREQAA